MEQADHCIAEGILRTRVDESWGHLFKKRWKLTWRSSRSSGRETLRAGQTKYEHVIVFELEKFTNRIYPVCTYFGGNVRGRTKNVVFLSHDLHLLLYRAGILAT
jgi:hypothetical protein